MCIESRLGEKIELNEGFAFNNRNRAGEVETPKEPEKEQKRQDRAASQRELTIRRRGQQVRLAKVMHGHGGILRSVLGKSRLAGCQLPGCIDPFTSDEVT
jgi:hypothetical protein